MIDAWKNRGLRPEDVSDGEAQGYAFGKGKSLYRQYQERLKALNAADFGDLLLETLHILRTHPDILADYRDRFRYMLVDEYQDTNVVQYLWLKMLAKNEASRQSSAWWATTTRASMAGAAQRWKTSCASSAIFPAPK